MTKQGGYFRLVVKRALIFPILGVLAVLNEAYKVEELEKGSRTLLSLPAHLSPIKAAVIPLKRNHDGIVDKARAVKNALQKEGLGRVLFENTGNIGGDTTKWAHRTASGALTFSGANPSCSNRIGFSLSWINIAGASLVSVFILAM